MMILNHIEKNNLDVVISGYRRVDDQKTLFSVSLNDKYEWSKYVSIAPWGKIYKKEFLDKNKQSFQE